MTYVFTDGSLGARLYNVADNLLIFYWIIIIVVGFVPALYTVIFSLVSGAAVSEAFESKIGKTFGFLSGFVGSGTIVGGFFGGILSWGFLMIIVKMALAYYIQSVVTSEMNSFASIPSVGIFPMVALLFLIVYAYVKKKSSKKKVPPLGIGDRAILKESNEEGLIMNVADFNGTIKFLVEFDDGSKIWYQRSELIKKVAETCKG